jgi:hypothetical protein
MEINRLAKLETKGPHKKEISSTTVSKYEKSEIYQHADISARKKVRVSSDSDSSLSSCIKCDNGCWLSFTKTACGVARAVIS